jgi:hypothetical protein
VYAYAKLDATLGRQTSVSLDHAVLHFDSAADSVNHTPEFNDNSVAGMFYNAPVMDSDCRVDQIAAERPQPR